MADPLRCKHVTLVGGAVTTVTLDVWAPEVELIFVSGAAPVYFTIDGTTPVAEADNTRVLPAVVGYRQGIGAYNDQPMTVKLISTGTPKVAVEVAQEAQG